MQTINGCYKHILAGLDLTESCHFVMQKAIAFAAASQASLSVVHIIEPMAFAFGGDLPIDLTEVQEQQLQRATHALNDICRASNYPIAQTHVLVGQPASELQQLAQTIPADLIIVGSRGRKGLALLLGSTSSSLLHGGACDILAVSTKKVVEAAQKTDADDAAPLIV